jgi:hypothetical protein
MKKIFTLFLVCFLMPVFAYAATLTVTVTTDKATYARSGVVKTTAVFKKSGVLYSTSTNARITIKDPANSTRVNAVSMTKVSTGTYTYSYTLSSSAAYGTWTDTCSLTTSNDSGTGSKTFTVAAADTTAPITTAAPAVGTYTAAQNVTLTANEAATIYYTTNGTTPTTASAVYSAPLNIAATTTLKYFARDIAGNNEAVKTALYTINITTNSHAGITGTFTTPAQVTAKCLTCHSSAGSSALSSLHGMMPTLSPNVTNETGFSQKLGEINSFCSYPNPAMAGSACLTCHPTLGKFENLAAADLDCLMCHNDSYKRSFAAETDPAKFRTVTDWQGTVKTYVPAATDASGNFYVAFNWTAMPGLTALDLVKNVKKPTTTTCLNCHAKAGGGDWVKRGDLGLNSANPTAVQDVHLASVANGGAGLSCTSCHVPSNHKIPGRGIDLRPTETGVTVKKCVDCHIGMDSGSGHTALGINAATDRHVKRIACQACHIANFGKGGATEMSRNWTIPTWSATLCNGQGAWKGEEVTASNVVPDLTFFNGTSYVYKVGQSLDHLDPITGLTSLADANGGINDAVGVSKLVPIKRHQSTMAYMTSGPDINKLIPYDVTWQFMTGFNDQAAENGKSFAGYVGTHGWKMVEAELAINHGVAPRANAATCAQCHGTSILNTSTLSKLDKLGYATPKPTSDLCNDCHGSETNTSHTSLHDKHVRSEGYNCNRCHSFTR